MSAHTDGPWFFVREAGFGADYVVHDAGMERKIATVHHYGNPDPSLANAKLIAAAPDLIDAAQHALNMIRMNPDSPMTASEAMLANAIYKATH